MLTQEQARERVARGAALLDKKMPGWPNRIDTGVLNLSTTQCILFQLGSSENVFNRYSEACRRLGIHGTWDEGDPVSTSLHGFFVPPSEPSDSDNPTWRLLQDAWIEAIAARLIPDGSPAPVGEAQGVRVGHD